MKIGNFEISFETVAALILFMAVVWFGLSSGQFASKRFWSGFAKGFLRIVVVVLVTQGLVFQAYLIEPTYLVWYNWIAFFGGLAYIIFILNPGREKGSE